MQNQNNSWVILTTQNGRRAFRVSEIGSFESRHNNSSTIYLTGAQPFGIDLNESVDDLVGLLASPITDMTSLGTQIHAVKAA